MGRGAFSSAKESMFTATLYMSNTCQTNVSPGLRGKTYSEIGAPRGGVMMKLFWALGHVRAVLGSGLCWAVLGHLSGGLCC